MPDQGKLVFGDSKVNAAHGNASIDTGFHGDGHILRHALLRDNGAYYIIGNPGSHIQHIVGRQLHQCPAPDNLAQRDGEDVIG